MYINSVDLILRAGSDRKEQSSLPASIEGHKESPGRFDPPRAILYATSTLYIIS